MMETVELAASAYGAKEGNRWKISSSSPYKCKSALWRHIQSVVHARFGRIVSEAAIASLVKRELWSRHGVRFLDDSLATHCACSLCLQLKQTIDELRRQLILCPTSHLVRRARLSQQMAARELTLLQHNHSAHINSNFNFERGELIKALPEAERNAILFNGADHKANVRLPFVQTRSVVEKMDVIDFTSVDLVSGIAVNILTDCTVLKDANLILSQIFCAFQEHVRLRFNLPQMPSDNIFLNLRKIYANFDGGSGNRNQTVIHGFCYLRELNPQLEVLEMSVSYPNHGKFIPDNVLGHHVAAMKNQNVLDEECAARLLSQEYPGGTGKAICYILYPQSVWCAKEVLSEYYTGVNGISMYTNFICEKEAGVVTMRRHALACDEVQRLRRDTPAEVPVSDITAALRAAEHKQTPPPLSKVCQLGFSGNALHPDICSNQPLLDLVEHGVKAASNAENIASMRATTKALGERLVERPLEPWRFEVPTMRRPYDARSLSTAEVSEFRLDCIASVANHHMRKVPNYAKPYFEAVRDSRPDPGDMWQKGDGVGGDGDGDGDGDRRPRRATQAASNAGPKSCERLQQRLVELRDSGVAEDGVLLQGVRDAFKVGIIQGVLDYQFDAHMRPLNLPQQSNVQPNPPFTPALETKLIADLKKRFALTGNTRKLVPTLKLLWMPPATCVDVITCCRLFWFLPVALAAGRSV